jgi:hypothetical protein
MYTLSSSEDLAFSSAPTEATGEGGLRLQFASGGVVVVFDTSHHYESFIIRSGEREIVV